MLDANAITKKRLGCQIGVRAVGQDAGFVLDFAAVKVQTVLGRTKHFCVMFGVNLWRGIRGNDLGHPKRSRSDSKTL